MVEKSFSVLSINVIHFYQRNCLLVPNFEWLKKSVKLLSFAAIFGCSQIVFFWSLPFGLTWTPAHVKLWAFVIICFRSKLLPLVNKFWICFKCRQRLWNPFIILLISEWRVSIYNKAGRVEPECLPPWITTLCIQLIIASLLYFSFPFSAKNWKFILNRKETGLLKK